MNDDKLVRLDGFSSDLDSLLENPFGAPTVIKEETGQAKQPQMLMETLPKEHQKKALEIAKQIDPSNHQAIVQYGIGAQSELSKFSNSILNHVQTKDTGHVGVVLSELMGKIKEVNPEDFSQGKKGFLARMFGSVSKSINGMLSKYQKIGFEIDKIANKLEKTRQVLYRDMVMLETLYEKNREYFDALNIYIAAAEHKLAELRTTVIPALEKKANESGNQMEVQKVTDIVNFADRLEKRAHDLKLSRQITIQTAPQIRMIQHVNQTLIERIQSSILTAIPLWKNQVVIAITLFRQSKAVEAQKQVSKTTNELLLKNSEMLKQNTIEAAKENERSVVDIETLKKTQENLIATLEETLKIQAEGRAKRQHAEKELVTMEEELKTRLLNLKQY